MISNLHYPFFFIFICSFPSTLFNSLLGILRRTLNLIDLLQLSCLFSQPYLKFFIDFMNSWRIFFFFHNNPIFIFPQFLFYHPLFHDIHYTLIIYTYSNSENIHNNESNQHKSKNRIFKRRGNALYQNKAQ